MRINPIFCTKFIYIRHNTITIPIFISYNTKTSIGITVTIHITIYEIINLTI